MVRQLQTLQKKQIHLINSLLLSVPPLENTSKLPPLSINTDKQLNTISFKDRSLKPTKAHGADNISICMIQLRNDSITLPLTLIFNSNLPIFTIAIYFLNVNLVSCQVTHVYPNFFV